MDPSTWHFMMAFYVVIAMNDHFNTISNMALLQKNTACFSLRHNVNVKSDIYLL